MDESENTENKSITETNENNKGDGKEKSCLAKLGVFVLVVGVISAIVAWIVYKVRAWETLFETIRQAEEGTFVGDNPTLVIFLSILGGIVSFGVVIYMLTKDK